MSLFAVTRGQFSMIDAVLHVLEACAPAKLSIWTWTIADYEIDVFRQLASSGKIADGTLVIDHGARVKNAALIRGWKERFGGGSVRYVLNHAKIATVEGNGMRVLLRGSMNLNKNPRFEQLDITEGGADFDLVQQIQGELEALPDDAPGAAVFKNSRVGEAFKQEELALFSHLKTWAK